jgi:hypothetical protein
MLRRRSDLGGAAFVVRTSLLLLVDSRSSVCHLLHPILDVMSRKPF